MALTPGQMNDVKGADLMLPAAPRATALIADRAYDADRIRAWAKVRGIEACIPSKKLRKVRIPHDANLYRMRSRIEIMFGRLKDWRRIATRYDRCGDLYFAAITIAAVVAFWL